MTSRTPLVPDATPQLSSEGRAERLAPDSGRPSVGQWFWVRGDWFGCVVAIGSNFVELTGPASGNASHRARIHFDEVAEALCHEPDHQRVLGEKIAQSKARVSELMTEVQVLTASLGVAPKHALEYSHVSASTELARIGARSDIEAYKQALLLAQKEALPRLRTQLRQANETLASWIGAEMIPLQALAAQSTDVVEQIHERMFSIELYAGLAEDVHRFADGEPAAANEKLRVFQRMLFCDEEALLAYDSGGLEISDLASFQAWLKQPRNRDRILPFPRCLVAMRVRREAKERDNDGSLLLLMHNLALQEADASTFLFIRNGERLYRISTALQFDELIFPDRAGFDPAEPMMIKRVGKRVDQRITRREFDSRLAAHEAWQMRLDAWERAHPRAAWEAQHPGQNYYRANPHRLREDGDHAFQPGDWEPFDASNVHYDEALAGMAAQVRQYNRVAVIIQGLFDRSDCLEPHPPVQGWTAEGFERAIELVYDGAGLAHAEPPCFESYRARCNALIDRDSILVGQQLVWMQREAERECRRIDKDPRSNNGTRRPRLFEPEGDPGPGYLARPATIRPKARQAMFAWLRERRSGGGQGLVRATLSVPFDELFNVSAYTPGDYRMFFQDPRTRRQYLKWAPLLMAAEDYHQGRRVVNEA